MAPDLQPYPPDTNMARLRKSADRHGERGGAQATKMPTDGHVVGLFMNTQIVRVDVESLPVGVESDGR